MSVPVASEQRMLTEAELEVVRQSHYPAIAEPRVLDRGRLRRMFTGHGLGKAARPTLPRRKPMEYLHTMVRITDIEASLDFWCRKLGLEEIRRSESEQGRYTLIFLAAPGDAGRARSDARAPMLELTYNWEPETYAGGRNFGHLAYRVDDIYATCQRLMDGGVTVNRPPRDGRMAFVRSPDGISIEILQKGDALPGREPWASMPNTGSW
jgi:lactoylglutathione lyase